MKWIKLDQGVDYNEAESKNRLETSWVTGYRKGMGLIKYIQELDGRIFNHVRIE